MNGSKCRTRVTFEKRTAIASDREGTPEVWEQVCEAYVCLEPLTGDEQPDASQQRGMTTSKATWRYSTGGALVTQGCRMNVGERVFNIQSVVNVANRNHWLEAVVVEAE